MSIIKIATQIVFELLATAAVSFAFTRWATSNGHTEAALAFTTPLAIGWAVMVGRKVQEESP